MRPRKKYTSLLNCCCLCNRIIYVLLVILANGITSKILDDETVMASDVQAVEGGVAKLPCDVVPPLAGDRVHLVIWYKEGVTSPIYSVDARGKPVEQAKHWSEEATLAGRAYFRFQERPARLTLESVRDADSGAYRCRVDFRRSPTRNSKVNLSVIIPPEQLMILDDKGSNIPHYILGPYNEGSDVDITCIATGGRPSPRVTWWQDNALLDDSWESLGGRRVRNTLHLEKLSRRQLHAVLTCQASSSPLAAPLSGAVTLDLNLRPLWVRLVGENRPLSADNTYQLSCEAVGTRPQPVFSWWKAGVQLRNSRETTSADGNTTTSTLTFVPIVEDSGKKVTCRAGTPLIPDSTLEDSWKLDIFHVPIVTLELGGAVNASYVREGSDVYFECNIKSNPWIYRVTWRHNGQLLYNNASGGTLVSNQSLVLQAVTRERTGFYTCVASNQEGDGESNPVYLDVKFRPVCTPGQTQTYGVARQETARVSCEVESNPGDGLSFSWRFNNSVEAADIPASLVAVERVRSAALYTPHSELDYGSLLCWAKNDVGDQQVPCVFHIVPAGKPDDLRNCSIVNQTADSLHVECTEGFDGGLPQEFVMEVYDAASQALVGNVSSRAPAFTVSGLQPGLGFDVVLFAANAKGRSRIITLHAYTLQPAERRAAETPLLPGVTPVVGAVAGGGALGALLLGAGAAVAVVRARRKRPSAQQQQPPATPLSKDSDEGGWGGGSANGPVTAVAVCALDKQRAKADAAPHDENNPDVVPHICENDYRRIERDKIMEKESLSRALYMNETTDCHTQSNEAFEKRSNVISGKQVPIISVSCSEDNTSNPPRVSVTRF
ncbi:nephrin-like isoform X1 [Schistocerca gregaria]|uniref:nephrin-like isoform X1 n=1 Tax=Schistocerca gregaria TaxID=7010 RepID=UPI00211DAFAA|nr:nephrin-like isoform X1 [Schistocerca gregaria]